MGRPPLLESRRRTREFVRQVAVGVSLPDAAQAAGVSPTRALRLLDDPTLLQVAAKARAEAAA